jgi:hypothetical protein
MDFDPKAVTGRVRPARSAAPLAPLPSKIAPPAQSPMAPSPAAAATRGASDPDRIEGTGTTSAPSFSPVTAPATESSTASRSLAPANANEGTVAASPGPASDSRPSLSPAVGSTDKAVPVPQTAAPVQRASLPPTVTLSTPPLLDRNTEEELVFLHLVRLMQRVIGPGTLSPVDRAFVAGAKAMLDHLSMECERMLTRRVSDLVKDPVTPPTSLSSYSDTSPETHDGSQSAKPRTSRKRAKSVPKQAKGVRSRKPPATRGK